MVVVAVMIVPLLTVGALALDYSWWQVGTEQLQTAADASALAAASALRLSPTNAGGTVLTTARTVAQLNRVLNDTVAFSTSQLTGGNWAPAAAGAAAAFTAGPAGADNTMNAVRVTVSLRPPKMFAGVARVATPTLSRSATVWVANVVKASCIRPIGMPWDQLWKLAGHATTPTASDTALTAVDLAALAGLSDAARTMTFNPAWTPAERDGDTWTPVKLAGTHSKSDYTEQFNNSVATCGEYSATTGGQETSAFNGKGHTVDNTSDGMQALCGQTSGADAQCAGGAGADMRVPWVEDGSGHTATFRMMGVVRVLCYFGPGYNKVKTKGSKGSSNCAANDYAAHPEGTVVARVLPAAAKALLPGDSLGTAPSGIQRLVLVR